MSKEQNTETGGRLVLGPVVENLMLAIRDLAAANNHFYLAFEAMGGESFAADKLKDTAPIWDAARDMLEKELTDTVRTWADSNPQTDTVN